MKLQAPSFMASTFYGIRQGADIFEAIRGIFRTLNSTAGSFAGDNMVVWGRTLGFMQDKAFVESVHRNTRSGAERGTLWRLVTLVWAARQAQALDGDFVECACYRGSSARIVTDMVGLEGRRYFLYDLFDHDETMPHHSMPEHSKTLYDEVRARFPEEGVVITQGRVPDSLSIASPERIAFMHLDLNNRDAEIGALEVLWDRIVPGGILILDDFGWSGYKAQHTAEVAWLKERGHHILELPTAQGLVIKH